MPHDSGSETAVSNFIFKAAQCSFSTFKGPEGNDQNHFYDLFTCNRENNTPATDTAPPAGLG